VCRLTRGWCNAYSFTSMSIKWGREEPAGHEHDSIVTPAVQSALQNWQHSSTSMLIRWGREEPVAAKCLTERSAAMAGVTGVCAGRDTVILL
jgi:hypothetical protein